MNAVLMVKLNTNLPMSYKSGNSSHNIRIIFLNPSINASHLLSGRQSSILDYRSTLLPLYNKSGKF